MDNMMNTTSELAIEAAATTATGTIVGNALDAAQKAIVNAITTSMTEGNVKLALAAGAGAALVGTGLLIYEYGGVAANAVSEAGNSVYAAGETAANWIGDTVSSWFTSKSEPASVEEAPIAA